MRGVSGPRRFNPCRACRCVVRRDSATLPADALTLGSENSHAVGPALRRRAEMPRGTMVPAQSIYLRYPFRMLSPAPDHIPETPRTVRLKTLIALRWFAVIGQAITVLVVHYVLDFELPLAACLSVIALSAWLNVAMSMHFGNVQRLPASTVAWLLAYDIAQLTLLVMLTGGLENPFAFFVLAPVSIAAISLPLRYTLPLALFAVATSTLIAYFYWPLPWMNDQPMAFHGLYIFATWVANLVAIVFISAYAWQV